MNLHEDIQLFEQMCQTCSPLYTIDREDGSGIVGKEFTYKGKQVIIMGADMRRRTIAMAPLVRGKPDTHAMIVVGRTDFDNIVKHHLEMRESEEDKKKKCSCLNWPYSCDPDCKRHYLFFAPFFGRGDGKSAAEINTGHGATGGSPAYPGAGGINAPGVGSGPNSGMGPAMSSAEFTGRSIMEDVKSISQFL